jgi:8-oxo-dGTP pyrophosphatase MutT (NUDIX family)
MARIDDFKFSGETKIYVRKLLTSLNAFVAVLWMNSVELYQRVKERVLLFYITDFQRFVRDTIIILYIIAKLLYEIAKFICIYLYEFYNSYLKKCEYIYRGIKITTVNPAIRPVFQVVCRAPKFLNWLDNFQLDKFNLKSILLTDVDFFGSFKNPDNLGFLKFKCEVYNKLGEPLDGIVFLRGDSAAVLIIVTDEQNRQFVMLTEQPRIPTGGYKEEIVAGMFDVKTGTTALNDVLKKEIKEETGLDVDGATFEQLGKFTMSGGGCDENVHVSKWNVNISSEKMNDLLTKQFGEPGSNEKIRLKFYPVEVFDDELYRISDAKTTLAWYL